MASQNPAQGFGGKAPPSSSSSNPASQATRDKEFYSSFLQKLLDVIGQADDATVNHVVTTVRSGASHDQILALVNDLSKRGKGT
ncbi:hypothetical protein N7532_003279 [Penicillium argentinense]|uniref:Uncharacterized protein n=1 Tax=Penicillium argentinense TaxID=1131581 RepID=A0A9W9KDR6_9EURO|nr:uncharacterized protein N7532_003279 [Penicillium argentinense]KAJ5102750.1 hypothetical protein N7532_003279 [Penicillium argentinense]